MCVTQFGRLTQFLVCKILKIFFMRPFARAGCRQGWNLRPCCIKMVTSPPPDHLAPPLHPGHRPWILCTVADPLPLHCTHCHGGAELTLPPPHDHDGTGEALLYPVCQTEPPHRTDHRRPLPGLIAPLHASARSASTTPDHAMIGMDSRSDATAPSPL